MAVGKPGIIGPLSEVREKIASNPVYDVDNVTAMRGLGDIVAAKQTFGAHVQSGDRAASIIVGDAGTQRSTTIPR